MSTDRGQVPIAWRARFTTAKSASDRRAYAAKISGAFYKAGKARLAAELPLVGLHAVA